MNSSITQINHKSTPSQASIQHFTPKRIFQRRTYLTMLSQHPKYTMDSEAYLQLNKNNKYPNNSGGTKEDCFKVLKNMKIPIKIQQDFLRYKQELYRCTTGFKVSECPCPDDN